MNDPVLAEALAGLRAGLADAAPPGMALAVASGGWSAVAVDGVRQRAGTGDAAPDADLPLTIATSHDLASVTKAVGTTAALLRLAALGELTVDTRVDAVLPGARTHGAGVHAGTTLRHLLQHRAGLAEWWPLYLPGPLDRPPLDRHEAFARLDAVPLRYPLDAGRHYSDLGFMLLGRVVEVVAAATLPDAVDSLVLTPLGLRSTRFAHPVDGADVAASGYGDAIERRMIDTGDPYPVSDGIRELAARDPRWRTATIVGEVADGNAFHAFGGVSGHAGLFSTVPDLLRIARALAGEEFAPTSVREQFAAAGPDAEQALGFRRGVLPVAGDPLPLLYHPGYTGCAVGWVPGRDIAVVLASNRLHAPAAEHGTPVPTDELWRPALRAAARLLAEAPER